MSRDITSRKDLEELLSAFYREALQDPLLRHVFVDVARMDLPSHLPVIVDFWEKVLFGTGGYTGRTMELHRRISRREPLTAEHFERWLRLWRAAVEQRFEGPVAQQATAGAERMAVALLRELTRDDRPARTLPLVSADRA